MSDQDPIRSDLAEVLERHSFGLDENRPNEVERIHKKNRRTARENIKDICDANSFIEYGALLIAAQRSRRSLDELIRKTPGDGLVAGLGAINGSLFDDEKARCVIMSYDYTVMAGTQGCNSHHKMDRILEIANNWQIPVVLFAGGGGGRPGESDSNAVTGLYHKTFTSFGELSGKVPVIGIVEGPCFAGNAALLGCCDVIIATKNSNIGMSGPAMIEGGGLGVYKPEEIGPIDLQTKNGVVDIAVEDEAEAVAVAKKYLSYFQGPISQWESADQLFLRRSIPENRRRVYDVRKIIETIADNNEFLELRREFAPALVIGLMRIEGKPLGIMANNVKNLGGAISADEADKATRFMQLCNVHGLPILSLVDCPGFMVGPDAEAQAQVRHVSRMFIIGSHLQVPFFTVVLRKGYGLGAMAMSQGGFHNSFFTASWPTGEFGGMGLEGFIKLGYKRELEAVEDQEEQEALFNKLVAERYAVGKAVNVASYNEIDAVIDPADTRRWILQGLKSIPEPIKHKIKPYVDTW